MHKCDSLPRHCELGGIKELAKHLWFLNLVLFLRNHHMHENFLHWMLTVTFVDPMDHYTTMVMADRSEHFPGQSALLIMSQTFLLRFCSFQWVMLFLFQKFILWGFYLPDGYLDNYFWKLTFFPVLIELMYEMVYLLSH
jgi:hypothetical protein